ncbi:MAG TPA: helix-turn-helix domain-containing protein [Solirubrobacterales bacterium]|nr:helix-turn-helix domain-containing protein [Solirubrobacterales bacterium]
MPALLTREQSQEKTREELVAAAARVFARRGYHRATVDEIASEAGYSTGAVYSNFDGKEALFLAIADRQVEARVAEIRAVADAAEADEDADVEAASQFRAFLEADPDWPLLFYEFWC